MEKLSSILETYIKEEPGREMPPRVIWFSSLRSLHTTRRRSSRPGQRLKTIPRQKI
jgi:hypothetical protein